MNLRMLLLTCKIYINKLYSIKNNFDILIIIIYFFIYYINEQ